MWSDLNQGREEGAVIDAWEDPNYEVYHTTDRFGFIQFVVQSNLFLSKNFLSYIYVYVVYPVAPWVCDPTIVS